jgi:hypothetical protein
MLPLRLGLAQTLNRVAQPMRRFSAGLDFCVSPGSPEGTWIESQD